MKRKSYFIVALALAAIICGGTYAYAFTQATATMSVTATTGDIVTVNATETQPNWQSILDDLTSENKTCGEVPTDDLFTVTPNPAYTGDLDVNVYLANTDNLSKAYHYLNMKVYMEGSVEADEDPNYRLVTLDNGQAGFTLKDIAAVEGTWTQTSQDDFEVGSTLFQVDTTTSPGDVILDTFSDNVTDPFDNEDLIAASANVTVTGSQVKLTAAGAGATETLRPNAAGDETGIDDKHPLTGAHWDKVDEVTSDNDSTYISTENWDWQEDLYNMPDHSTGSGSINYVKVYAVANRETKIKNPDPSLYIHIKTNGVEYNGTWDTLTETYAPYSYQWDNNPQTGNPWTWDEIDALQIGVGIRRPAPGKWTQVTQVYVEVNYTAYNPTGTITSINLLSGETVKSIDDFYYIASAIPSGTSLKVQFSQDNTNWYNSSGNASDWDDLSQGTHTIDLSGLGWSGPNFYYHMLFTSDGTGTPVLDEISIIFSTYYTSGTLTSSAYDSGYDSDWGAISFTVIEPSATDIKFQIRTAATEAGLSTATWYGPTSTTDYYQTSCTAINSVHDGDRWIQYKVYFSDSGLSTPTLSDISITYAATAVIFTVEITGGGYCLVSDNTSEWGTGWTVTPELYCEATHR